MAARRDLILEAEYTARTMTRTAVLLGAATVLSLAIVPTDVPSFEVDPFWPRPLPNHWILGSVTGVAVDARDHVWLVHRGMDSLTARTEAGLATDPPTAESCCAPAPPVLEFDPAGNLVGHWGGPGTGYTWPKTPAGIDVDRQGSVWIRGDAETLKFTRTGTFVEQRPVKPPPLPGATCVRAAKDGNVYVCDRKNDTLEVISHVGSGGRYPGHFYGVGSVAVDSKGNLYTGETYEGKRLQKFIYKGLGPVVGGRERGRPAEVPSRLP